MLDMLKKGVYVGLGLASMTREKVEAVAKEISEKAKLSEEEGRKFSETLHKEAENARKNFDSTVESAIERAYAKVPCSKRFDALDKRLAAIEAALNIKKDEKPG